MKKQLLSSLLLFLSYINIQAQDSTHLGLNDLLLQIETNYPTIIQFQYKIQALEAMAEGAKAWMPPTFSAGTMQMPFNPMMAFEKNNPMNQAGIGFAIEQMIPNPSKLNAKKDFILSQVAIEKSKSTWTQNELRKAAKILYYNRYTIENKQTIVAESEDLLNLLITIAEAQFSNNQSELQTIYKAKAQLAELRNMQFMLHSMVAESNIGLNTLLLRDVQTIFEIDSLLQPKYAPDTLNNNNDISSRSDILTMSNSIESMKLEQKMAKLGNQPEFGIRVETMAMFGMPSQWSVMGMVSIPIVPWSAKMYKSETKSIGFEIQAMEQEKESMELMAKRMLAEKIILLKYEIEQYKNYKNEIIPAYENNLQANLLAYKQNTGDFFGLLDAWQMILMKKIEMSDKLFNILKLEAEYEYEKEIK